MRNVFSHLVCKVTTQMPACICCTQNCYPPSSLNKCPFKDSVLLATLSLFLAVSVQTEQFLIFFTGGFEKALSLPLSMYRLSILFFQSLIIPLATFLDIPSAGLGTVSGCEEPFLASWSAVSFPSIPMCPGTHISLFPFVLPFSPGIGGSPRLNWNLSGNCQGPDGCLPLRKNVDGCSYL